MPNQQPALEKTFGALADPTRRAVIQALSRRPASVTELAKPFAMALPSFVQHLRVLEHAGLLISSKQGRTRICSLNPQALRQAESWLATHRRQWEERLDRLEAHIENVKQETTDHD